MMTEEEIEYLRKHGYLFAPDEKLLYTFRGTPIGTFTPKSPMLCQSGQIPYDMSDLTNLTNAYCSALHTVQAAKMDDICNHFAHVAYNMAETPYNEPRKEPCAANNAKREGLLYVPLKPKSVLEDFWDSLDISEQCDIVSAMWTSFVFGVVIPFCIMWLICDELLPFF